MSAINITNARKELYNLVENVNLYSEPTLIVSKKGNAVLVSESDWNAIQETVYLNSIPGMVESIRTGLETSIEDCVPEEDVECKRMYKIVYTKQAVKDIKNLKSVHLDEKAKILIDVIRENPFQNPPPFEALMGNLQGAYSRRINIQHRLVYEVCKNPVLIDEVEYEGTIKIIRMWTHYDKIR